MAAPIGSGQTVLMAGLRSFRNRLTPASVPPEPIAAGKAVTRPSVGPQISGPVVLPDPAPLLEILQRRPVQRVGTRAGANPGVDDIACWGGVKFDDDAACEVLGEGGRWIGRLVGQQIPPHDLAGKRRQGHRRRQPGGVRHQPDRTGYLDCEGHGHTGRNRRHRQGRRRQVLLGGRLVLQYLRRRLGRRRRCLDLDVLDDGRRGRNRARNMRPDDFRGYAETQIPDQQEMQANRCREDRGKELVKASRRLCRLNFGLSCAGIGAPADGAVTGGDGKFVNQ